MAEDKTFEEKQEAFDKLGSSGGDEENTMFVGLGRKEVLEESTKPFWRTLRIILLVVFWLSWLALLVGGAAIVVMNSSDCKDSSESASEAVTNASEAAPAVEDNVVSQ